MSLYPNILFHFTKPKENLFEILSATFKVSYAREVVMGPDTRREFAIPMVSFCDLRLTELKNHMDNYGSYGIGLTKEWANSKGLNPVMYLSRHCKLADNFMNGLNGIYTHLDRLSDPEAIEKLTKNYTNILTTYQYIKNYEGNLFRDGELKHENYRFADEREWRYVPPISETGVQPFVALTNIDTREKKQALNQRISHLCLRYQPEDIKYLIVERDDEIAELITHLRGVKGKFDDQTLDRLASRILTAEQILQDI
jgi:hypothetical protein